MASSSTRPGRMAGASTGWPGSGASGDDADPLGDDEVMTEAAGSSWKDAEVAGKFLDERRRAIPLDDEQVAMMLHLARHFVPQPGRVIDLGCGDGLLARA